MSQSIAKSEKLDEAGKKILLAAIESGTGDGGPVVCCDRCQKPIEFERVTATSWVHHCPCGKYNGTLMGM